MLDEILLLHLAEAFQLLLDFIWQQESNQLVDRFRL